MRTHFPTSHAYDSFSEVFLSNRTFYPRKYRLAELNFLGNVSRGHIFLWTDFPTTPEAGNTVLIINLLNNSSYSPSCSFIIKYINCVAVSFVNMIIIKALLLFLLYDGTFGQGEPSQACQNITEELNANQACQQAFIAITSSDATDVTRSDLEAYCTRDCRDIVEERAMECVS